MVDDVGDSPFEGGAGDGAGDLDGEPGDPAGAGAGVIGRLFDGSVRGPTVDELKMDYGLSFPWAISLRGLVRVSTGTGVPPIFEILMGSILATVRAARDGDEGGAIDVGSADEGPL